MTQNSEKNQSQTQEQVVLRILQLPHARRLALPDYQTLAAAGFDVRAAVPEEIPITLSPGARDLIPTGLIFEIPHGYEAQVRPRSGLAVKHGVTVLNSPGTIDADYRGEVKVALINLGTEPFVIEYGMRIAQIIIQPVVRVDFELIAEVSKTDRGAGGFGSTGV